MHLRCGAMLHYVDFRTVSTVVYRCVVPALWAIAECLLLANRTPLHTQNLKNPKQLEPHA